MDEFFEANRRRWDELAGIHVESTAGIYHVAIYRFSASRAVSATGSVTPGRHARLLQGPTSSSWSRGHRRAGLGGNRQR